MNKDERFCTDCQQWKAPSEFYTRKSTKSLSYTAYCKACYKLRSKKQVRGDKRVSTVPSEDDLTKILWRQGIPALPGKSFSHAHADIICWSCVFIEVKYGAIKGGTFKFGFSHEQSKSGLKGHIIALVLNWGDETTYHLFDNRSPLFRNADGTLKTGLMYTPNRKPNGKKAALTPLVMETAKDNWSLIEDYRKSISEKLINGADFVQEVKAIRNATRQLKAQ